MNRRACSAHARWGWVSRQGGNELLVHLLDRPAEAASDCITTVLFDEEAMFEAVGALTPLVTWPPADRTGTAREDGTATDSAAPRAILAAIGG